MRIKRHTTGIISRPIIHPILEPSLRILRKRRPSSLQIPRDPILRNRIVDPATILGRAPNGVYLRGVIGATARIDRQAQVVEFAKISIPPRRYAVQGALRCRVPGRAGEGREVEDRPFEVRELGAREGGGVFEEPGFVVVVAREIGFLDELAGFCARAVVGENEFVVDCRAEWADDVGGSGGCYDRGEDVLVGFCAHASHRCGYGLRRASAVQFLAGAEPSGGVVRWSGGTEAGRGAGFRDEAGNDGILGPRIAVILDRGSCNVQRRATNSEKASYHPQIGQRV